jgi:hypothetical protein
VPANEDESAELFAKFKQGGDSVRYEPVTAPRSEPGSGVADAMSWIASWTSSPALLDLIDAFGAKRSNAGTGTLQSRIGYLADFAATHWDFRGWRERNLASEPSFSDELATQILESAEALGLVRTSRPQQARYDHVLILGGLVRACILRPEYAADLLAEGLQVGEVSALGGFRSLGGDEPALARAAGLDNVRDEFAAMDRGVRRAFGYHDVDEEVGDLIEGDLNRSWLIRTYGGAGGLPVRVIAAPSLEPEDRRANSADTYQFWADRVATPDATQRVLLVTSSIYVPYQGSEAIRMLSLRYGCGVETIGLDTNSTANEELRQEFEPSNFLQEINSTIRSIRGLHESIQDKSE